MKNFIYGFFFGALFMTGFLWAVAEPLHDDPTGAEFDAKKNFMRCRDANGITWESRGECD